MRRTTERDFGGRYFRPLFLFSINKTVIFAHYYK